MVSRAPRDPREDPQNSFPTEQDPSGTVLAQATGVSQCYTTFWAALTKRRIADSPAAEKSSFPVLSLRSESPPTLPCTFSRFHRHRQHQQSPTVSAEADREREASRRLSEQWSERDHCMVAEQKLQETTIHGPTVFVQQDSHGEEQQRHSS